MLSGPEILRQIGLGNIVIKPFDKAQLNPNSYDVTLADQIATYVGVEENALRGGLDLRTTPKTECRDIPATGLSLRPGRLYLASTVEWTETRGFVPQLNGKSSLGRLGIKVHQTAGFGDDGFRGRWTLEIEVIHPVRIYKGCRIAQICWFPLEGERLPYSGRFQDQETIQAYKLA